jgi:adenylate cyclase
MYGELVPVGGGDPIPLLKSNLMVGRRESCDIVLRFGNVSGQHCELVLDRGWWFVKDLGSQNGTRVNGLRVSKKRMDPGDRLTIARNDYEVRYSPAANGGDETNPPEDDVFADIMGRSLLESAGLHRREKQSVDGKIGRRRASAAAAAAAATGNEVPSDASQPGPSAVNEPNPINESDESANDNETQD